MRAIYNVVLVVLVATAGCSIAEAQRVTISLGGGAALPLSYLNTGTNTGVHGVAAVSIVPARVPLSIRIDGMYSRFGSSSDRDDGHIRVFQGTANAVYRFRPTKATSVRPYLIGGLGLYNYKTITEGPFEDEANTDLGLNGGGGVDVAVGALGLFAEARYHNVFAAGENPEFLPITVGVRLGGR